MAKPKPKLNSTPLAITTRGEVLLNLTTAGQAAALRGTLEDLGLGGRSLFIGVVLEKDEHQRALTRLEDAAAEIAARISAAAKGSSAGRPRARHPSSRVVRPRSRPAR